MKSKKRERDKHQKILITFVLYKYKLLLLTLLLHVCHSMEWQKQKLDINQKSYFLFNP